MAVVVRDNQLPLEPGDSYGESIHFPGVLRGQLLLSRFAELGMPALEGRVQIAIQHLDSHLQ